MKRSIQTAWRHFYAHPTHFRSNDVKNVNFMKTAITPSIFTIKTKLSGKLYQVSQILKSAYFHAEIGEKIFKNGYHGYKNIDTLYLSKGAIWDYSYNYS